MVDSIKGYSGRKYKIVYITPAIYSAGGVERVVTVKANYFVEHLGHNVTIIVTEGNGRDSFFPISDKVKVLNYGLDFEKLWQLPFWKKVIVFIHKQRKYKKLLKSDLLRIRPDFTISTLRREINFITKFNDASIKVGELHVNRANYRNADGNSLFKRIFAKLWMKNLIVQLRQLDRMIVLTDSAFSDWPELNNVVKIPDSLPFKIEDKSELNAKRLISIGRYAYDKGNDLLLQVWSLIEKDFPEWILDIYGNGDREPYLKQMNELGLDQQRCHLCGTTSDVKNEYLSSSIFVLPSRFEGFGLVLIESMACGVPVVAFDCENGPRSIITNGVNGFLIPPFDILTFAEKIKLLMNDVALRKSMGKNAQKAASKYEMDKIGPLWEKMFDELKEQ